MPEFLFKPRRKHQQWEPSVDYLDDGVSVTISRGGSVMTSSTIYVEFKDTLLDRILRRTWQDRFHHAYRKIWLRCYEENKEWESNRPMRKQARVMTKMMERHNPGDPCFYLTQDWPRPIMEDKNGQGGR